jgi:lipopolysaccharide biosynthesis protein
MQFPVRLIQFIEEHLLILLKGASTDIPPKKIAVVVHLFYLDLWEEISSYLSNLADFKFDLYVTLVNGSAPVDILKSCEADILKKYPSATVMYVENRGLDIGAFMGVLDCMLNDNMEYDYLIKLHGKRSLHTATAELGNMWRRELYNTMLGSPTIVKRIHALMSTQSDIGMVGSILWNISTRKSFVMGYGNNYKMINQIAKEFKLTANVDNFNFIAGTMFWADYKSLVKPLRGINRQEFIQRFETGACSDDKTGTLTHTMERILALFILSDNKKVVGI